MKVSLQRQHIFIRMVSHKDSACFDIDAKVNSAVIMAHDLFLQGAT